MDALKKLLYDFVDDQLVEFWYCEGREKGKEFEKAFEEVLKENLDNFVETLYKQYKEIFEEEYGVTNPEDMATLISCPLDYKLPKHLEQFQEFAPDLKYYVYDDIDKWISKMCKEAEKRMKEKKLAK